MLDEGVLNAALFLSFLQRLVRSARSKMLLIVDPLEGARVLPAADHPLCCLTPPFSHRIGDTG
jgi:hypothetical protein